MKKVKTIETFDSFLNQIAESNNIVILGGDFKLPVGIGPLGH